MSVIGRWECPRCGSVGGNGSWCQEFRHADENRHECPRVWVEYVDAATHRGAVDAIRTLRAYIAAPESSGTIRYIDALKLCDSILNRPGGQSG